MSVEMRLFVLYENAVQELTFVVLFRSMHTVNWHRRGMLLLAKDTYLSFLPNKSSFFPFSKFVSVKIGRGVKKKKMSLFRVKAAT